jgi:hypothetical protein
MQCTHKHWSMVADTSGVHKGYHCLDCGFNLEQPAPRETSDLEDAVESLGREIRLLRYELGSFLKRERA